MTKKISPLAVKRGPQPLTRERLLRQIARLKKRPKSRYLLPTTKMWPGQVRAGIEALKACLWMDPSSNTRRLVYETDHEKIVIAVFRACVKARLDRKAKLKARRENPHWSPEARAKQGEKMRTAWARRKAKAAKGHKNASSQIG